MESLSVLAWLIFVSGMLSLLCLLILHFVSREFQPSWRMVSEYALGKHKWLLTLFFVFWGISSLLTAGLLWNIITTNWAKFGVVLVFVSGLGALMGGLFDVKHKLHGTSFLLGVPTLPVGALLVSYHLIQDPEWAVHQTAILRSAHSVWVSLVLMAIAMMLLFSGFKKAGMPMDPNTAAPEKLPPGVIGVSGYANRLLIVCYIGWLIKVSTTFILIV